MSGGPVLTRECKTLAGRQRVSGTAARLLVVLQHDAKLVESMRERIEHAVSRP